MLPLSFNGEIPLQVTQTRWSSVSVSHRWSARPARRRGMEVGGEGDFIYLSLHCHHQNDFCIRVGSDESHFNVSLIVRDKVTRQCPQTTTFEEKGEPKQIRTEVLLLTSLTRYRKAKPAHIGFRAANFGRCFFSSFFFFFHFGKNDR